MLDYKTFSKEGLEIWLERWSDIITQASISRVLMLASPSVHVKRSEMDHHGVTPTKAPPDTGLLLYMIMCTAQATQAHKTSAQFLDCKWVGWMQKRGFHIMCIFYKIFWLKLFKAQAQSNFLLFSYVRSTCPPAIICLRWWWSRCKMHGYGSCTVSSEIRGEK